MCCWMESIVVWSDGVTDDDIPSETCTIILQTKTTEW